MKMTEFFLEQLEREASGTRHTLARVPEGKADWKPHPRSMSLGHLAALVATMPGWVEMTVNQDELELKPQGERNHQAAGLQTRKDLIAALEENLDKARKALRNTTDEHLLKTWRLKVAGKVVNEQPRYVILQDAVFNHLAHHRGQLTVYLRLNESSVPAIYGPSADEGRFEEVTAEVA